MLFSGEDDTWLSEFVADFNCDEDAWLRVVADAAEAIEVIAEQEELHKVVDEIERSPSRSMSFGLLWMRWLAIHRRKLECRLSK